MTSPWHGGKVAWTWRRSQEKRLAFSTKKQYNPAMATKTCYTCKQTKDLEDFHKSIGGSQGRSAYCKPCTLAQRKIEWKRHRERQAAAGVKFRVPLPGPQDAIEWTCVRCKQVKPITQFGTQVKKDKTIIKGHCNECASKATLKAWNHLRTINPHLAWAKQAHNQSRIRARERGLAHSIVVQDLLNLAVNEICAYCDRPVLFQTKTDGPDKRQAASVDRFIPDEGYTVANCVLVCYRCNTIKNDATLADLERMVSAMRKIAQKRLKSTPEDPQQAIDPPIVSD